MADIGKKSEAGRYVEVSKRKFWKIGLGSTIVFCACIISIKVNSEPSLRVNACLSEVFVSGDTVNSNVPLDEVFVSCNLALTASGNYFLSRPRYFRTPFYTIESRDAVDVTRHGNSYKYRRFKSDRVVWKLLEF